MLDIAYRCFESCGKPQPLDHGVTIHSLKHWLHPWATLIRMAEPSRAAVVELKRYFDQYSYAQDLEFRTPFVSVFAENAVDPKLEAELKGLGFGDYQSTIEICVYDEAIEAVLHDDFEIYQARLDEPECQRHFASISKGAFAADPQRIHLLLEGAKAASNPWGVFLLRGGQAVAGGLVFRKGEYGFMFSGGVLPEYRHQGLWRNVLSLRQQLSAEAGVKYWAYITQHEHLKRPAKNIYKNGWFQLNV